MRWRLVGAVATAGAVLGVGVAGVPGTAAEGVSDVVTGLPGVAAEGVSDALTGLPGAAADGVSDVVTGLPGAAAPDGPLGHVGSGADGGVLAGGRQGDPGGLAGEGLGGGRAGRAVGAAAGPVGERGRAGWPALARVARGGSLFDLAFQVVNINSGKCLTVTGGGVADGAILIQRACSKDPSYRWRFVPVLINGAVSFLVVNVHSGKCVTFREDGTAVQLGCDGDAGRRWRLQRRPGVPATVATSDALVQNVATRKCLTIAGGSVTENAVALQGDCDAERARRWTVRLAAGPSLGDQGDSPLTT
jgi:hypothetical protein